jgi:hypothetical protein
MAKRRGRKRADQGGVKATSPAVVVVDRVIERERIVVVERRDVLKTIATGIVAGVAGNLITDGLRSLRPLPAPQFPSVAVTPAAPATAIGNATLHLQWNVIAAPTYVLEGSDVDLRVGRA